MTGRIAALAAVMLLVGCALTERYRALDLPEGEPTRIENRGLFLHAEHEAVFEQAGWSCASCHRVGAVPVGGADPLGLEITEEEDLAILLPPSRLCHDCHAPGASADAPVRCKLCHEQGEAGVPDSHGAGWETSHDREALVQPDRCFDCHESWTCVRCHVRRDTIGHEVHPGTWLALHGMAARTDPTSCEDCHEGASCQQCHLDESGLQGW